MTPKPPPHTCKPNRSSYTAVGALVVLIITFLAFQQGPPVLGFWEASTVFFSLSPYESSLDLRIHPRANIGGYQYAPLEFIIYITQYIGLSLRTVRLPSIILSLVTLYYFYSFCKKWLCHQSALYTTLLLATAPSFFFFQHQLIINMTAITCLMILIYYLNESFNSAPKRFEIIKYFFVGASASLCCLFYAPIRAYMIFLILFTCVYIILNKSYRHVFYVFLTLFTLSLMGTLTLLNSQNMGLLLSKSFLSPSSGEHIREIADLATTVIRNLNIILRSLFNVKDSRYFGIGAYDTLMDVRSALLEIPTAALFIAGVVICIFSLIKNKKINSIYTYTLVLITFLITFTLPLLSSWVDIGGQFIPTMSTQRAMTVIIPSLMLAGLTAHYIFKIKSTALRYVLLAIPVTWNIFTLVHEHRRFNDLVNNYPCTLVDGLDRAHNWNNCGDSKEVLASKNGTYELAYNKHQQHLVLNEQISYLRYAKTLSIQIKNKLNTISTEHEGKDSTVYLLKSYIWPLSIGSYKGHYHIYNFHQIFLATYLNSEGLEVGFIKFYEKHLPRSSAVTIDRAITAEINFEEKEYSHSEFLILKPFYKMSTSAPKIFIVTTPQELSMASAHYKKNDVKVVIL